MVDTKSTNLTSALLHVLSEVLGEQPQDIDILNGPFTKAFNAVGIQDINDLLAIDPMVDFNDITISEVVLPSTPVRSRLRNTVVGIKQQERSEPSTSEASQNRGETDDSSTADLVQGIFCPKPKYTSGKTLVQPDVSYFRDVVTLYL